MSELIPGPCGICGKRNYPLSMGGRGICPECDCGASYSQLRRRVVKLEEANAELRETVRQYEQPSRGITEEHVHQIAGDKQ